MAASALHRLV